MAVIDDRQAGPWGAEHARCAKRPTLITTNLGYDEWGTMLKNPPMAEALLSRLKQRCVTLEIDGPDLRDPDKQN